MTKVLSLTSLLGHAPKDGLPPCDVAVFRRFKSCIEAQASATIARSVIDGSFEGLAMHKAWRRQSSAEWASRATMDLCCKNEV